MATLYLLDTNILIAALKGHEAVRRHLEIRAHLESHGTPMGANDLWIAAQARSLGATLVTDNQRESQHVPELLLDNWLAAGRCN
mgnify:CR=1 FL=1